MFSIREQFDGATVLLTGASGYIGSLAVEQLLRTTSVGTIYVLLRDKRGVAASTRLASLLRSALFHLVRDKPELVSKVVAVSGDILQPGLGLSARDLARLQSEVQIFIHAAADIRLEAEMHDTLASNYVGTRRVLDLAAGMTQLRALVHVSTAYVNMNQPPGSVVLERLYTLKFGVREVDAEEIAEELLTLPRREATARATIYNARWGFPNTYCLGKHLAEHMAARVARQHQLPLAIVRPSLVVGVAGAPYPGYIGNWAGPIGMGAAVAIGLFPSIQATCNMPTHVWDAVPGDMTAHVIIATAAAVAAGAARAIVRATGSGGLLDGVSTAPRVAPAAPAPAPPASLAHAGLVTAAPGRGGGGGGALSPEGFGPFSDDTALSLSRGSSHKAEDEEQLSSPASGARSPLHPSPPAAPAPPASAAGAGTAYAQQDALLSRARRSAANPHPLLIVHATTSTTYPVALMEAWNWAKDFFGVHKPAFSISRGGCAALPYMSAEFRPDQRKAALLVWWTGIKVAIICFFLRLFGFTKQATKLSVGYAAFEMNNKPHLDRNLYFDAAALIALAQRVAAPERLDYLLVWRPAAGAFGAGVDAAVPGTKRSAGGGGGAVAPRHPCETQGWRQFSYTTMAGLMRNLYGVQVPASAPNPYAPGETIEHEFQLIR